MSRKRLRYMIYPVGFDPRNVSKDEFEKVTQSQTVIRSKPPKRLGQMYRVLELLDGKL